MLESQEEWVIKPLVIVKYPKDDILGMFFGYYSLLVYEIQAVYVTLFLWNRDLLTFYCCFTHMISEIMNYTLKHILKQPRPEFGPPKGGLFEGKYAMPSQHVHCAAYLATTMLLWIFHYYRRHIRRSKKILAALVATIGVVVQISSRVYLKCHTMNQCLVGLAFGTISAIMFYSVGLKFFLPYSEQMCNLWLLRIFSFKRDLISQPPSHRKQISAIESSRIKEGRHKLHTMR